MGFSLKKWAEEAVAQINPFDGGKTAQTVRQARQAPPAVTQRAPQVQQQPSYGSNIITRTVNRARDVVDANTPQDKFKRQIQNRPTIDITAQDEIRNKLNQVKNTALNVGKTIDNKATNVVNVARDQLDANTQADRTRRLNAGQAELYVDQQRAKGVGERSINNNIAQRAVNTTRSFAEGMASGPLALGRAVGNTVAMNSGDYKRAEQAERQNREVTDQVNATMWKVLRDPNASQAQKDHAVKVLNIQQPAGMQDLRAKIASESDPRRLAAAAADTGLTIATAGMAGVSKQGVKAAYNTAKTAQLAGGATVKQAANAGVKAGIKNLASTTAKSTATGAGAGFAGVYTADPNATLKQGLTGAVQGGVMGGALPLGIVGASYAPKIVKAGIQKTPAIVRDASIKAGQLVDSTKSYSTANQGGGSLKINPLHPKQWPFNRDAMLGAINGDTRQRMSKTAFNVLQSQRGKSPYATGDGLPVVLSRPGNRKYTSTGASAVNKNFIVKQRITPHIKDALAKTKKVDGTLDKKIHGISPDGFDHYGLPVTYRNEEYSSVFDIGINKINGRNTLYEGNIRKASRLPGEQIFPGGDASNHTIPNSTSNVNPIRGLGKLKQLNKDLGQGGYVKSPLGGKGVDPLEALKAEARKYKSVHQGGRTIEVDGEPIKIADGLDTFIHKDENGNWVVSEATSGRSLTGGGYENKTFAVKAARELVDGMGVDKVRARIAEVTQPKPPVQKPTGGTLRPDKAPEPYTNLAVQSEISPERARQLQANVDELKAFMASGKSKYTADTPTSKAKSTQKKMTNEQFRVEAMRVRDNLKAGEVGYVKDGNKTYEISRDNQRAKLVQAAPVQKLNPTTQAVDADMQEVIDGANKAIADGDIDNARMLADTLPEDIAVKIRNQADDAQRALEKNILGNMQEELSSSIKESASEADNAIKTVVDKISKHFSAPGSVYKLTGFKRTYTTPSGSLKVGGDFKTAMDRTFFNTDLPGFTKNVKVLADKFGGAWKEISDLIDTGLLDEANYDKITGELYGRISKRPAYARRPSTTVQGANIGNAKTAGASKRVVSNNSKQPLNDTIAAVEEAGAKTLTKPKTSTRVVPQIDEPFDAPLTKTQNVPPTPPKPPTGTGDQKAIGAGQQKKSKFADETIPKSEFVSQPIKDATKKGAPLYTPETERINVTDSVKRLKAEGDETFGYKVKQALDKKEGTISRQEAIDAQVLAAKLEEAGDEINISKASDIYDKLSAHYTKAGQLIQAAAMMTKRSPAGMKNYAKKQFTKAGVKVTPEIQSQVDTAIAKLAKTKVGTDANAQALDEVMHTIAKNIPANKADLFVNTWRANLLTAPTTTFGGFIGGVDAFLNRKLWTNPVATMVDMATSLFTGKRSMTLNGGFAGGAKKGMKAGVSKQYWKTGYDEIDGIAKGDKYDQPRDINFGNSKAGKALGGYVNSVYRTMGLVDKPWKHGAKAESLRSIAKADGLNKGYSGKQLKQYVDEFIANPPESAVNRANAEGKYAVFQDQTVLGEAAMGMSNRLKQKGHHGAAAVVDFLVPFKQIPSSIATRIVKRTPIGTAHNIVKQIVDVKKGGQFDQRAFSQATAEGFSGVPIVAAGYALAQAGQITGGYPSDNNERKLWQAEGKQPNSVKVGDRWYSLNYIQPFGALLNIGAGASQADKDGKDGMDVVWAGLATGGKSFTEMSFLQGVSGALDAAKNPEMAAERFVQNTGSSLVPNFVRSFANASDKYERQASGVKEGIQSAIPGWRQQLPAKKDAYGNNVETKDNFLNRFVNPLKPSIAKNDDVTAELRRLKDNELATMPSSANKNALGEGVELNKKQITDLNAAIARDVTKQWEETMKTPEYINSSDEDKKKMLNKIKGNYTKVAKSNWAESNGIEYKSSGMPSGLNKTAAKVLNTYNEDKASEPNTDQSIKDTLKNWNNGEEVPVTNEVAKAWAEYEKKRLEGSISDLEMNKEKKSVLRKAYSSVLNKDEKDYYNVPDNDILAGLEQGLVTEESLRKAMDVDALLVRKGLISSSGFGKKVWNALGMNAPKGSTASSSTRTSSRSTGRKSTAKKSNGRKSIGTAKKAAKYDYNIFGMGYDPTSKSKSLRELVKKATAKA